MGSAWLKVSDIPPSQMTPMLRQYLSAKAEAPDSLLFFRMGDFYELFFEDALEASEILGIALTSRDGAEREQRVPMCGVPVRAVETYLAKLLRAGRKVTICEQVEDPREAKGIVRRSIVRTITPGTVLEPTLLDERTHNFLAAVIVSEKKAGLAFADITTGEFFAAEFTRDPLRTLLDELARIEPAEILVPDSPAAPWRDALRKALPNAAVQERGAADFDLNSAPSVFYETYGISTLKGIGLEGLPYAAGTACALLHYLRETQRDAMPRLQLPRRYDLAGFVMLDSHTQRNLELVRNASDGGARGTLLHVLDRTLTSMGARKLRHYLLHPLTECAEIHRRLEAVDALVWDATARREIRESLRGIHDLERLLGRITAKAATPRDLKALAQSLSRVPTLRGHLKAFDADLLSEIRDQLEALPDIVTTLEKALTDEPPLTLNEGYIFREGYDAEVDHLRELVRGAQHWIAQLRREESERTGISNLKIGYNKIFGYYIEVSRAQAKRVPADYERKQTLVNVERFVTPALKAREQEILTARERMNAREYELFVSLRDAVAECAPTLHRISEAVAALDVLASFAYVAASKNYVKPLVDESGQLEIREGRHPVVEDLLPRGQFVPNDTLLDPEGTRLQIVTGPNMAGKSTYLRQVALIVLMAQIGSFVPAARARIGVVDRIFTRVGAADNLARGESTFMVEMIETANILHSATPQSLLILDEIGRGTSTFDGISIAWSVAEYIHDTVRAKALFATHYHELTQLGDILEHAKNVNVAVREHEGKVVFLYRIVDGGADHSYGIHVAQLAGLPRPVIRRAREILHSLESGSFFEDRNAKQLLLFTTAAAPERSEIEKALEEIDPDALSPREAHEWLYRLKHLLQHPRH